MDGRTGFAAGGFIVGATAVAVACAVTLSNSAALADAPGIAAGLDVVRVSPSGATVAATPHASTAAVAAPEISAPPPSAEVVPAPEPRDVSVPAPAPLGVAPAAVAPPAPVQAQAPFDGLGLSEDEIQAEALRTGSWARLRAWAIAHGWPQARIEQWIAGLQPKAPVNKESTYVANLTQTPANAGTESGLSSSDSKRTQSPRPPRGD